MPIGSSLGITLPTQGGNTGTWGTDLNTELNKIITAVEAQVPITALDVSATFDLNSQAMSDVDSIAFANGGTTTALRSFYVTAGELYYRDGANNPVQMTNGGVVNTASNGNIGSTGSPAYGTSGVVFNWDGTRYSALDGSGADDYANVRMGSLELRDGSSNTLTVDVPAMGSDYTLSLPAAAPAGDALLQMDASGNVTASSSIGTDITLTGSAEVKHGSRTKRIGIWAGQGYDDGYLTTVYSGHSGTAGAPTGQWTAGAGNPVFHLPIDLESGCRITQVRAYVNTSSAGMDVYLGSTTTAGVNTTNHETAAATGIGDETLTMTVSPNLTLGSGGVDFVYVYFNSMNSGDEIYGIDVTYDRP